MRVLFYIFHNGNFVAVLLVAVLVIELDALNEITCRICFVLACRTVVSIPCNQRAVHYVIVNNGFSVDRDDVVIFVVQIVIFTCIRINYIGQECRNVEIFHFEFGHILDVEIVITVVIFEIRSVCGYIGAVVARLDKHHFPAVAVPDVSQFVVLAVGDCFLFGFAVVPDTAIGIFERDGQFIVACRRSLGSCVFEYLAVFVFQHLEQVCLFLYDVFFRSVERDYHTLENFKVFVREHRNGFFLHAEVEYHRLVVIQRIGIAYGCEAVGFEQCSVVGTCLIECRVVPRKPYFAEQTHYCRVIACRRDGK